MKEIAKGVLGLRNILSLYDSIFQSLVCIVVWIFLCEKSIQEQKMSPLAFMLVSFNFFTFLVKPGHLEDQLAIDVASLYWPSNENTKCGNLKEWYLLD